MVTRSQKKLEQKSQRRAPLASRSSKVAKASLGRTTASATPLHLRAPGVAIDPSLDAYLRKRVASKLAKFALGINRVSVRLDDESGPKGAKVFTCRVKVVLPNRGSIVLETHDGDLRAAFDHGIDATERAVRRLMEKGRATRRSGG